MVGGCPLQDQEGLSAIWRRERATEPQFESMVGGSLTGSHRRAQGHGKPGMTANVLEMAGKQGTKEAAPRGALGGCTVRTFLLLFRLFCFSFS